MATHKYQWLLFDADDTLFDYQKAEPQALDDAFRRAGIAVTAEDIETYRAINHKLWQGLERGELTGEIVRVRRFELLFEVMGVPFSAEEMSQVYVECLGEQSALIDGAVELLETLRGKYHMAIVTNGLKDVQRSRLARSAIRKHIEALIISEEVGASKPAGAFFDAAFAAIGNPAKESALIIGDSLTSDMAGGAGYGIDTCWFNPSGKPRPADVRITYEIARLGELIGLLG